MQQVSECRFEIIFKHIVALMFEPHTGASRFHSMFVHSFNRYAIAKAINNQLLYST
jgi:hypothetical protein